MIDNGTKINLQTFIIPLNCNLMKKGLYTSLYLCSVKVFCNNILNFHVLKEIERLQRL